MSSIVALFHADLRTALTYRLQLLLSIGGVLVSIVPIYFIAGALQPVMEDAIRNEGAQYFGFVVVGTVAFLFVAAAVNNLPAALGSSIRTGTFEALMSTPASLPSILVGFVSYNFTWVAVRGLVMLVGASLLGAQLVWGNLLSALVVLGLTVAAYLAFGILGAVLVLLFRTTGPFLRAIVTLSALLGGVYYPTHVIPSWIHDLTFLIPLTYGLRALRRTFMDGASLGSVFPDIAALMVFVGVLLGLSLALFSFALQRAKRAGTLAQY